MPLALSSIAIRAIVDFLGTMWFLRSCKTLLQPSSIKVLSELPFLIKVLTFSMLVCVASISNKVLNWVRQPLSNVKRERLQMEKIQNQAGEPNLYSSHKHLDPAHRFADVDYRLDRLEWRLYRLNPRAYGGEGVKPQPRAYYGKKIQDASREELGDLTLLLLGQVKRFETRLHRSMASALAGKEIGSASMVYRGLRDTLEDRLTYLENLMDRVTSRLNDAQAALSRDSGQPHLTWDWMRRQDAQAQRQ